MFHIVTRYPTGRREIKLLLLVFELTVSSRQKKWSLRKNVGHRGDKQMLVLGDLTQVAGHQEEEERSQMIGRDPKTEVGTPSPQRK